MVENKDLQSLSFKLILNVKFQIGARLETTNSRLFGVTFARLADQGDAKPVWCGDRPGSGKDTAHEIDRFGQNDVK
jgi:hypothetical protein